MRQGRGGQRSKKCKYNLLFFYKKYIPILCLGLIKLSEYFFFTFYLYYFK